MSKRSRDKGGVGERECAEVLRAMWPNADRAPMQARGASRDGCEVIGTPFHVEVKYAARIGVHAAYAQGVRDCAPGYPVLVMTRRISRKHRNEPWLATLAWHELHTLLATIDTLRTEVSRLNSQAATARGVAVQMAQPFDLVPHHPPITERPVCRHMRPVGNYCPHCFAMTAGAPLPPVQTVNGT